MSKRNAKLAGLAAIGAIATFPGLAPAQSPNVIDDSGIVFSHRIFADSPGWQSCKHWIAARSSNREQARAMEAWALGYATGYSLNRHRGRSNHYTISNDRLFSAIDQKCREPAVLGLPGAVDSILEADVKAKQD